MSGGDSVDALPLQVLIGPAAVIDFSDSKPGREISVNDLDAKLAGRRHERLLFRFDWSKYWGKDNYYKDYPFFSVPAASLLIERGVRLVGLDTPSPDNPAHCRGALPDSPVHKLLLSKNIILVEYLCNLGDLRKTDVELCVLPLKIKGGDGAPARCVAIELTEGGTE